MVTWQLCSWQSPPLRRCRGSLTLQPPWAPPSKKPHPEMLPENGQHLPQVGSQTRPTPDGVLPTEALGPPCSPLPFLCLQRGNGRLGLRLLPGSGDDLGSPRSVRPLLSKDHSARARTKSLPPGRETRILPGGWSSSSTTLSRVPVRGLVSSSPGPPQRPRGPQRQPLSPAGDQYDIHCPR